MIIAVFEIHTMILISYPRQGQLNQYIDKIIAIIVL